MSEKCSSILRKYRDDIKEVVQIQKNEKRESIFFIYEDGSTIGPFKGKYTSISLTKEQEKMIQRKGNIIGSVHTHPTNFQFSTIDVVTGISSGQDRICIATPVESPNADGDFVLTCLDFSEMSRVQKRQAFQAMRRSSMGITNLGRVLRRELNFKRFKFDQCRIQGI